ncbi:MAG: DUF1992 domain-containing protein [Chloroflexota bacterium]|nr:DUF1992 domain-containing protein [Chloroflexota bacterium]
MSSLIDEIIREAQSRGEFDNLPGSGKKLALDADVHTPDDLKLAYRVMKENDLLPDWIAQGKALEKTRAALIARITRSSPIDDALAAVVARYNSEVLTFNLKLPSGIPHRPLLNVERVRRV